MEHNFEDDGCSWPKLEELLEGNISSSNPWFLQEIESIFSVGKGGFNEGKVKLKEYLTWDKMGASHLHQKLKLVWFFLVFFLLEKRVKHPRKTVGKAGKERVLEALNLV